MYDFNQICISNVHLRIHIYICLIKPKELFFPLFHVHVWCFWHSEFWSERKIYIIKRKTFTYSTNLQQSTMLHRVGIQDHHSAVCTCTCCWGQGSFFWRLFRNIYGFPAEGNRLYCDVRAYMKRTEWKQPSRVRFCLHRQQTQFTVCSTVSHWEQ